MLMKLKILDKLRNLFGLKSEKRKVKKKMGPKKTKPMKHALNKSSMNQFLGRSSPYPHAVDNVKVNWDTVDGFGTFEGRVYEDLHFLDVISSADRLLCDKVEEILKTCFVNKEGYFDPEEAFIDNDNFGRIVKYADGIKYYITPKGYRFDVNCFVSEAFPLNSSQNKSPIQREMEKQVFPEDLIETIPEENP